MASVPSRPSEILSGRAGTAWLAQLCVAGAALGSLFLIWLAIRDPMVELVLAAVFLATLAIVMILQRRVFAVQPAAPEILSSMDRTLLGALIADSEEAVAITDISGRLVTANTLFETTFGGLVTPPSFGLGAAAESRLASAARSAWRDGKAEVDEIEANGTELALHLARTGSNDDFLVWRFQPGGQDFAVRSALRFIEGEGGERLGHAGLMIALVDSRGCILAANGALINRSGNAAGSGLHDVLLEGIRSVAPFAGGR